MPKYKSFKPKSIAEALASCNVCSKYPLTTDGLFLHESGERFGIVGLRAFDKVEILELDYSAEMSELLAEVIEDLEVNYKLSCKFVEFFSVAHLTAALVDLDSIQESFPAEEFDALESTLQNLLEISKTKSIFN